MTLTIQRFIKHSVIPIQWDSYTLITTYLRHNRFTIPHYIRTDETCKYVMIVLLAIPNGWYSTERSNYTWGLFSPSNKQQPILLSSYSDSSMGTHFVCDESAELALTLVQNLPELYWVTETLARDVGRIVSRVRDLNWNNIDIVTNTRLAVKVVKQRKDCLLSEYEVNHPSISAIQAFIGKSIKYCELRMDERVDDYSPQR